MIMSCIDPHVVRVCDDCHVDVHVVGLCDGQSCRSTYGGIM